MKTCSKIPANHDEDQGCRKRSRSDTVSRVTKELGIYNPNLYKSTIQKFDPLTKIAASNLSNDLIAEIFARLALKPLLKFRCVSRYWDSLISSKQFVKTHLQTNANNTSVLCTTSISISGIPIIKHYSLHSLFFQQTTYAADISCPPIHPNANNVTVVGTVNGLCCLRYRTILSGHIVLWNPSTTKFFQLPDMDYIAAFTTFGFGLVNGSDDDYKVLCTGYVSEPVRGQQTRPEVLAAIYSLKTGSWRLIPNLENCIRFKGKTRFVCGKIHWLALHEILSFDLGTEEEGLVTLPSNIREGSFTPSLSKLGGCLCLFLNYPGTSKDLWVMKDYGIKESWVKVVTIPNATLPCDKFLTWIKSFIVSTDFTPLYVSEDGVILFLSALTFIIYNPKDEAFRYPHITSPNVEGSNFGPDGCHTEVNIQSLVSPLPDV